MSASTPTFKGPTQASQHPQGQGRAWQGGRESCRQQVVAARLGHLQSLPSGQRWYLGAGPSSMQARLQAPLPEELYEAPSAKRSRSQRVLKIGNWSNMQLKAAIATVERGCHVQTTILDYDVPRSTLRSHVMGLTLSRKRGRKPVLSTIEEEKLVQYIYGMARYGHPFNLIELKIKLAKATQLHNTPFIDGIHGVGQLHWFKKRHLKLSLHMSQRLDASRVRGLYLENVSTFYKNLEYMLQQGYEPSYIQNCDKFGVQVGRIGEGQGLAKKEMRSMHSIIPKEHEWLSMLVCVNTATYHIPNFYILIFLEKRYYFDIYSLLLALLNQRKSNQKRYFFSKQLFGCISN